MRGAFLDCLPGRPICAFLRMNNDSYFDRPFFCIMSLHCQALPSSCPLSVAVAAAGARWRYTTTSIVLFVSLCLLRTDIPSIPSRTSSTPRWNHLYTVFTNHHQLAISTLQRMLRLPSVNAGLCVSLGTSFKLYRAFRGMKELQLRIKGD